MNRSTKQACYEEINTEGFNSYVILIVFKNQSNRYDFESFHYVQRDRKWEYKDVRNN